MLIAAVAVILCLGLLVALGLFWFKFRVKGKDLYEPRHADDSNPPGSL